MIERILIIIWCCLSTMIYAQVPAGISFQAVVRDDQGAVLAEQTIKVRISVLEGSANGTVVYAEEHRPMTNNAGLFTLIIGNGNSLSGTFGDIDWSNGNLYIKREIDPTGGNNFVISGTLAIQTIPYSFYANLADSSRVADSSNIAKVALLADSVVGKQQLTLSNDTIYLSDGGAVKIPGINQGDILDGSEQGEILYWNGSSWVALTKGNPGQQLFIDENGLPKWTGDAYPTVITISTSNISATSVSISVNITFDGGQSVSSRGVVYGTSDNPTLSNSYQVSGSGTGSFNVTVNGLIPNTTYYVRGYATNAVGTGYGSSLSFTTTAPTLPILSTNSISSITQNYAVSGGVIISDGGNAITAKGVVWSINTNPTLSDNSTSDGTGTAGYNSVLTGLSAGVTYYVRAYATNSSGTGYGDQESFTSATTSNTIAIINLDSIGSIGLINATAHAEITAEGGGSITERGIVWNTSSSPTVNNNKISSGSGSGVFSVLINSGLQSNRTYYIRAYAVNNYGIAYSNELSFTTITGVPTLTTNFVTASSETASSGGNITDDGGSSITARGVVWSTTTGPTISDNKTEDGTGTGNYNSTLTGLTPSTLYYVRAYATNTSGTGYGEERSITTSAAPTTVTDIDGNVYNTVQIGDQVWMKENLKTSRYNTGSLIPYVVYNESWNTLSNGAWSYYKHDENNNAIYGKLYNWYAVEGDSLCPIGWHVPSDAEWTVLTDYLGGESVAGGKLKEVGTVHWNSPNTGATDEVGFTALPGGIRSDSGLFQVNGIGDRGAFWSTTPYSSFGSWVRNIGFSDAHLSKNGIFKRGGISVRCLRD